MANYNLERFIAAQQKYYDCALSEIKAGHKRSHWMWFIFPQIKGLGQSDMSIYYAITDLQEAKAYMADPYLRENLLGITQALLSLDSNNAASIMGYIDDKKLCSSMTLFEIAAPDVPEFAAVLDKFYDGERDKATLQLLGI